MNSKDVDLLKLIRKPVDDQPPGLRVARVNSTEPNPETFTLEGSDLVLDIDLFEVPPEMYPLRDNDLYLAYPIVGGDNNHRWALLEKISGGIPVLQAVSPGPDPTFKFEKAGQVVDPVYTAERFEIPVDMNPIRQTDRFLVRPIDGDGYNDNPRWALTEKVTGGVIQADMTGATSCNVINYGSISGLIVPDWIVHDHVHERHEDVDGSTVTYSPYFLRGENLVVDKIKAGDKVIIEPTGPPDNVKYVVTQFLTRP